MLALGVKGTRMMQNGHTSSSLFASNSLLETKYRVEPLKIREDCNSAAIVSAKQLGGIIVHFAHETLMKKSDGVT